MRIPVPMLFIAYPIIKKVPTNICKDFNLNDNQKIKKGCDPKDLQYGNVISKFQNTMFFNTGSTRDM